MDAILEEAFLMRYIENNGKLADWRLYLCFWYRAQGRNGIKLA